MNWKKDIIKFLSAQTISLFGSSLVQYAIIWHITLQTQSGIMMSIATICGYVPQLLISLWAGVWIDRYSRKFLCMASDAIIAGATCIVMLAFFMGFRHVELLFLVLLIRSFMSGIQTPAVSAIIPQIVPSTNLMKVNGIYGTIQSVMMFLSPAASGMILSFMDIEYTFLIDIMTAVIGIGIMFTLPIKAHENIISGNSMKEDMVVTWHYLQQEPLIRNVLVFMFLVCFFISPAALLTPLMISRTFGVEVWRLTMSEMTFSLGAVAGGILISSWGGFRKYTYTILASTAFYGLMMIGLGFSPFFAGYLLFNFLIGISMPCFNTPSQSLLQEQVEEGMLGRIFSLVQIANACALPLGSAIFGPLADCLDVHVLFVGCGSIVVWIAWYGWYDIKRKHRTSYEKEHT